MYVGIGQSELNRLQLVQNAADCLLTGTKKREHMMLVLSSLHWLPVRYRIYFKIILFIFKSLNGLAPDYLSDLVKVHQPSRALRSADQMVLDITRSLMKTRGDGAFAVVAHTLWNALPLSVWSVNSLSIFKTPQDPVVHLGFKLSSHPLMVLLSVLFYCLFLIVGDFSLLST